MGNASKQLDENLAQLAWSLWTELGVKGLERNHQDVSITPEELILLTSVLSGFDPRLRDEALDWCSRYHSFISATRLQICAKKYQAYISKSFSIFSTTFNSVANVRTKWIVLTKSSPLSVQLSGKSTIRSLDVPSMIHFRLRSLFGLGARADILSFLLNEQCENFSASDLLETGYSKRCIAGILSDLTASGILSETQVRNQFLYSFVRRDQFITLLGNIPKKMINWQRILAVLLPIRACLQEVEDTPVGVRVVDMVNLLNKLAPQLKELTLNPPTLQKDFEGYWKEVVAWILEFSASL